MAKLIAGLVMLISVHAFAATYYISPSGNDSTGTGATGTPWLTLSKALSTMAGGDTLICKDGTYTGDNNAMSDSTVLPPNGTSGAWTIIKAEHDGAAIFDGENARTMFFNSPGSGPTNRYWQFEGLIWCRAGGENDNITLYYSSYVKFLRCGAYDAGAGNTANFSVGRGNGSYILLEGCYSWGTGRYKFMGYQGSYIIFRNCVARPDGIDAGGDPIAAYAMYSVTHGMVQNCIAVDGDQTARWTNVAETDGCFFVPCTDATATDIYFDQCVGLNVKMGGFRSASNTDSSYVYWRNSIAWDCTNAGDNYNQIRGSHNTVLNCTEGEATSSNVDTFYWDGANGSLTNSLFYHLLGSGSMMSAAPAAQDYNCYYSNNNTNGVSGTHNLTTTNPMTNSLKWLPRIEAGSSLKGAGSGGADIGANCMTLIGTAGTLWGETGYATDTGVSMWPFPNEALIKSKMAAYTATGITGARGFCTGTSKDGTSQTLTKYIWEYLGNQIPSSVYGSSGNGSSGFVVQNLRVVNLR